MSRPIAEQAAARGIPIDGLLGMTPLELLKLGFDVSPEVPVDCTLAREEDGMHVDTSVQGRRTGFVWYRPAGARANPAAAEMAAEEDAAILAELRRRAAETDGK